MRTKVSSKTESQQEIFEKTSTYSMLVRTKTAGFTFCRKYYHRTSYLVLKEETQLLNQESYSTLINLNPKLKTVN